MEAMAAKDPMIGHFIFSRKDEGVGRSSTASMLLLKKTVELMSIFSSSKCCSKTSILYCVRWISLTLLDWNLIASQFTLSDWIDQTRGSFNFAILVKVQFSDTVVPFNGHVSITVILPSNCRVNSSNRASSEVVDEAFTEL